LSFLAVDSLGLQRFHFLCLLLSFRPLLPLFRKRFHDAARSAYSLSLTLRTRMSSTRVTRARMQKMILNKFQIEPRIANKVSGDPINKSWRCLRLARVRWFVRLGVAGERLTVASRECVTLACD
jgi:hypothetical protein